MQDVLLTVPDLYFCYGVAKAARRASIALATRNRRVFLAPDQNGHSAGKSEAVVDIARTNHLAVFDTATNLRRLNIGAYGA